MMNRAALLIGLLSVLTAFFFFNVAKEKNMSALISGGAAALRGEEKEFAQPVNITWAGKVFSVMSGGSCLAVRGQAEEFGGYSEFMACLPDTYSRELFKYSGDVQVAGKWLGITCAYKNTVFGECVPDVEIDSIH